MRNDYIHVFDLKAGLPKAQLKPFNTTPLHGIVHASLSGLESLAHDLGYAVLSPFGKVPLTSKKVLPGALNKQAFLRPGGMKTEYTSKKDARNLPATFPGSSSSSSTIPIVIPPQSTTTAPAETVIPELDLVSTQEDIYVGEAESSPNYTLYVIAGFLTIGAIGFGVYHYQNKKKPSLDKLDKEARGLQRQLQGMAKVQPQMDYTRTLNNPLLRKLGSL